MSDVIQDLNVDTIPDSNHRSKFAFDNMTQDTVAVVAQPGYS